MKTFGIKAIRSWKPCYGPERHLAEDWTGTAIDILNNEKIPIADRLWCVLRTDLVSERTLRLFAVWSARQVQHLMKDTRSLAALDVAQRFAMGEATRDELYAAWAAARAAAWATAREAARDAARDAAGEAAGEAAREAARVAAWAAARAAAWDAAWDAASDAAWAAAKEAQKNKLIEMIMADEKENSLDPDYDPTPWCSWCHAMSPDRCKCGPRAEND